MNSGYGSLLLLFVVVFGVLIIVPLVLITLPDIFPTHETITGTVKDIQISAGGFMNPDLTTLIFNDGRVITFVLIHNEFRIGGSYKITYHWSGVGANNKLLVVSIHKNYADYSDLARKYSVEKSFLTLASTKPIKPFGLGNIDLGDNK